MKKCKILKRNVRQDGSCGPLSFAGMTVVEKENSRWAWCRHLTDSNRPMPALECLPKESYGLILIPCDSPEKDATSK